MLICSLLLSHKIYFGLDFYMGMNNKYLLIIFMLIVSIAYIDLLDCFKRFDVIMSQMIELDSKIKTEIDTKNWIKFNIQK